MFPAGKSPKRCEPTEAFFVFAIKLTAQHVRREKNIKNWPHTYHKIVESLANTTFHLTSRPLHCSDDSRLANMGDASRCYIFSLKWEKKIFYRPDDLPGCRAPLSWVIHFFYDAFQYFSFCFSSFHFICVLHST